MTPTSVEGITAVNKTTNASGQATFRLPFARWSFKAKCAANNELFFSGNAGHCFIPGGCLTAKITMPCGQCTGQPNGTACNDATACSGTSTCQSQKCTGAQPDELLGVGPVPRFRGVRRRNRHVLESTEAQRHELHRRHLPGRSLLRRRRLRRGLRCA